MKSFKILTLFLVISLHSFAQTYVGYSVSGTWTRAGSPYYLNNGVIIADDSALIIEPGVTVMFQNQSWLVVKGKLTAIGTASDSITFTSINKQPWFGIRFNNQNSNAIDSSIFAYCNIQYANTTDFHIGNTPLGGGFFIDANSKVHIDRCRISNCKAMQGGGIYALNGFVLTNSYVGYDTAVGTQYDPYGGGILGYGKSIITGNTITHNIAGDNGGGMSIGDSSIISNNIISYNQTIYGEGGGMDYNGNGAISGNNIFNNRAIGGNGGGMVCNGNVMGNIISNNYALYGGGGILYGGGILAGNIISGDSSSSGGGLIFSDFAIARVQNNTIANNYSTGNGGGIEHGDESILAITGNTIRNNTALEQGGGIYAEYLSNDTIKNNIIDNNSAHDGGGILLGNHFSLIENNTISHNMATSSTSYGGGGIEYVSGAGGYLINNIITDNSGYAGGGILLYEAGPEMIGNIISNNSAAGGGAIYFYNSSGDITNCTITNNNAVEGGGAIYLDSSSWPTFANTIVWSNVSANGQGNSFFIDHDLPCFAGFNYCDFEGGTAAFYLNKSSLSGQIGNNLNADPLFISPASDTGISANVLSGNWRLRVNSPCLNAGKPDSATFAHLFTDIANEPRFNSVVDMGAYEYTAGCHAFFTLFPDSGKAHSWIAVNQSSGAQPITYAWHWGDGDTSVGKTPSHIYASEGSYSICVSIKDSTGCSSTYCNPLLYLYRLENNVPVTVNVVNSISDVVNPVLPPADNYMVVMPNPCSTCEITGTGNNAHLTICNVLGQVVNIPSVKMPNGWILNLATQPSGIYLVKNTTTGQVVKFVKQ